MDANVENSKNLELEAQKWREAERELESYKMKLHLKDEDIKWEIWKNEELSHEIMKLKEELKGANNLLREKETLRETLIW